MKHQRSLKHEKIKDCDDNYLWGGELKCQTTSTTKNIKMEKRFSEIKKGKAYFINLFTNIF